MRKVGWLLAVLAMAGALGATAAQAQMHGSGGAAGHDIFTLNVYGGGYSPLSSLRPGSEFRNSGTWRDTWFPYLVAGIGGKTYDFDRQDRETDFAGNFGAGIEYRFARWGIQAEVRDVVSNFDRFGVDKFQHDIVWTAGFTLSF